MTRVQLQAYQEKQVALLASGAYVLTSFKNDDLKRIAEMDFQAVEWEPHPRLITIRSPRRGSQARFGWVSRDGEWLCYRGLNRSYGHVQTFRAQVEMPGIAITRLLEETPVRLRKPLASGLLKLGAGFLIDSPQARYNTMLCVNQGELHVMSFELDPPAHASHEQGLLTTLTSAEAEAVRAELSHVAKRAVFNTDPKRLFNTRIEYSIAS